MSDLPTILVVDDDAELGDLLGELLGQEGFTVEHALDGTSGLARAQSGQHALVVLDVMLPGLNGIEVLQRLRRTSTIPVLMLTARGDDVDRIVGLELGADDYLAKPFHPRELVARVRAIHRRAAGARAGGAPEAGAATVVDDLELHAGARRATIGGKELRLTTAEYDLLEVLARHAGTVVSREELTKLVLGRRLGAYDRAIDMHVSNLRKKLGPSRTGAERIKTVRSTGYILTREG